MKERAASGRAADAPVEQVKLPAAGAVTEGGGIGLIQERIRSDHLTVQDLEEARDPSGFPGIFRIMGHFGKDRIAISGKALDAARCLAARISLDAFLDDLKIADVVSNLIVAAECPGQFLMGLRLPDDALIVWFERAGTASFLGVE
ncbi:MAG: hypothetical protein ACK5IP_14580 [Paracoccus sp. (in: a-proteobacteria)]